MRFLAIIFIILISCSENLVYNEPKPHLSIEAYCSADSLSVGDTVHLQAKINPNSYDVIKYFWIFSSPDTTGKANCFLGCSHKLLSKGHHFFTFYAIDAFSDTVSKKLAVVASSKVACEGSLEPAFFQGSPIFAWECADEDPEEKLEYSFKLINIHNGILLDTVLQESKLQWGKALPNDYFKAQLIAKNSFGGKDWLNYEWSKDE